MRATRWLRAASVLLTLFFLGHTAAVVLPSTSSGPREDAALQAMKDFHFDAMGRDRTIWDFWLGFNVLTSVALAILVVVTWQLGALARKDPALATPLVSSVGLGSVLLALLNLQYFFAAPAALSTLAAACVLAARASLRRARSS